MIKKTNRVFEFLDRCRFCEMLKFVQLTKAFLCNQTSLNDLSGNRSEINLARGWDNTRRITGQYKTPPICSTRILLLEKPKDEASCAGIWSTSTCLCTLWTNKTNDLFRLSSMRTQVCASSWNMPHPSPSTNVSHKVLSSLFCSFLFLFLFFYARYHNSNQHATRAPRKPQTPTWPLPQRTNCFGRRVGSECKQWEVTKYWYEKYSAGIFIFGY